MTQAYWTRDRVAEEFEIETRVLPWIGGSKAYTAAKSWWCTYDLLIRKDDWTPDFILAWALKQESEVGGVLAKNLHQAVPQIFEYVGPKMQ